MLAQRQSVSCAAPMRGIRAVPRPLRAAPRRSIQTHALAVDTTRFVPRWSDCYKFLKGKQLETVTPEAAAKLIESREWVLVDVRRDDQHAKASPKGSVSIPLYQKLDLGNEFSGTKLLKTMMFAFNGVDPIDANLEFNKEVAKLAAAGKGVIFACEAGGTMKPSVNFSEGKASRSLQASYKAIAEVGHDKVKHLERGIYGWYQAGFEFNGDYKPEIGRYPTAASEPTVRTRQ